MKKFIEDLKKFYRHNQFFAFAVFVVIGLSIWLIGCESMTPSPTNPEIKVTRAGLENEIVVFKSKVAIAAKDLDRQDAFKQELFNIGLAVAQGGAVDPIGAGVTLMGILGIGAMADNRKKNSLIKMLQNEKSGGEK